jgi:D-alanyl-D-alanine carboxypeptidase (penicillin-binding protein 5/6)
MDRRILTVILLVGALLVVIGGPLYLFLRFGTNRPGQQVDLKAPPLAPLAFTPASIHTPPPALHPADKPGHMSASEALLMDAESGTILYEKQGETPLPMASTTKIMTALIAIQAGNLDQVITVGQDAVAEVAENDGSGAGLFAGDRLTLRDLLYGLMLPSGDDAAIVIADGLAGSQKAFVKIMNAEAQKLRLFQTRYSNADGLDYGLHYTTPYDLARLARYALRIPLFAQIVLSKAHKLPATSSHHAYSWPNINQLLFDYQGSIGVKTGWTPTAGGCLVFAATRNGHTLIGVILHSADEQTRFTDAKVLLNWGFGASTRA